MEGLEAMTVVWSGLALGAVYALVAIGYNIVFIATKTFNFAQAQLIMIGAFITYTGIVILGLNPIVSALIAMLVVALVSYLEYIAAIRPVKDQHNSLVTTLGAATLLDGGAQLIWGGEPRRVCRQVRGVLLSARPGFPGRPVFLTRRALPARRRPCRPDRWPGVGL